MFWRNARTRKSSLPSRSRRFCLLLAAALFTCAVSSATDKLKDLQDHFDKEDHAGRKIKDLQKLAPAQFSAATDAANSGNYSDVGLIFEKYRDNVRAAFDLLKKQEPDADKHSASYRQLELGIRQGLRQVEDVLLVAPEAVRPPLQIVHKDLLDMDDALINALFPRRTNEPVKAAASPDAKP
jgi:hypothetical protein